MSEPRYGIWAPVGGNFGLLNSPDEPIDASYDRFVIARPTEEEAKAEFDRLMALQKQEEHYRLNLAKGIDPEAVMFQIFAKNPAVGGNGGTAAGLVCS